MFGLLQFYQLVDANINYVVFVDDYSHYIWIYPLCNKSDIFQSFVKFKLLVKNLFSSTIKQLQSYGGGEYTSQQFQLFL